MLGINAIRITPKIMAQVCAVDEFNGMWQGVERYTTGLQIIGNVAQFGANFQRVLKPLQEKELSIQIIQILHSAQTGGKGPTPFRAVDNELPVMQGDVPAGLLDTAPHAQVEKLMKKLVAWLNTSLEEQDIHPLVTIAIFTAVFLQISPFDKGNMRTMRFLLLLLMMKAGYAYAPFAPVDRIMTKRAGEVFAALKNNQQSLEKGRPDWDEWLTCFFAILEDQAEMLRTRLDEKKPDVSGLPTLSGKILNLFAANDRLQMKDIIKQTNGRRSTIKLRLQELVDEGYLRRHGQARATWYSQV